MTCSKNKESNMITKRLGCVRPSCEHEAKHKLFDGGQETFCDVHNVEVLFLVPPVRPMLPDTRNAFMRVIQEFCSPGFSEDQL
jgi:hypothetical protein